MAQVPYLTNIDKFVVWNILLQLTNAVITWVEYRVQPSASASALANLVGAAILGATQGHTPHALTTRPHRAPSLGALRTLCTVCGTGATLVGMVVLFVATPALSRGGRAAWPSTLGREAGVAVGLPPAWHTFEAGKNVFTASPPGYKDPRQLEPRSFGATADASHSGMHSGPPSGSSKAADSPDPDVPTKGLHSRTVQVAPASAE